MSNDRMSLVLNRVDALHDHLASERAKVKALRGALEPFAAYGRLQAKLGRPAPRTGDVVVIRVGDGEAAITVEHLTAAISALAATSDPIEAPSDVHPTE